MITNNEQDEMPFIGVIDGPKNVSMKLIEVCDTKEDAIRLCWCLRRDKSMTMTKAAERMGLSKAQLSKIIDGYSGMRGNQERVFQFICGNRSIAQFLAWELGCELVDQLWAARQARAA